MSQLINDIWNWSMRTWNIQRPTKYVNDQIIAKVAELEFHEEYMGESYLSVTVNSEVPIDFKIGDYIYYRYQTYSLSTVPACKQQASKGSSGDAFVYENMKFNSVANELATCDFLDVVLSDNNVHWTALSTFSFYCENVKALADRIQANLDRVYGENKWVVEVGSYDAFDEEITIDKQTVWDALALVDTTFHTNFIIRGRHIYIGTEGTSVDHVFKCGVGNGLVSLERTIDDSQKVVTRLRAYGNTTNMPSSYYLYETMKVSVSLDTKVTCRHGKYQLTNRNGVCYVTQISLITKNYVIGQLCETVFNDIGDRLIIQTIWHATGDPEYYIDLEHSHPYVYLYYRPSDESEELSVIQCYVNYSEPDSKSRLYFEVVEFDKPVFRDWFWATYGNGTSIGYSDYNPKEGVFFYVGGDNIAFDDVVKNHSSILSQGYYPNNMAVTRIMLPGFPSEKDFEKDLGYIDEKYKGYKLVGSKSDVYIESPNFSQNGLVEGSVYIDGTDNEYTRADIYPSIEGVTFGDLLSENFPIIGTYASDERIDEISNGGCTSVDKTGRLDNGNKYYNKSLGSECYVYLKDIGFDINNVLQKGETPVLHMKSGMCVGREFDITQVVSYTNSNNDRYRLTIARKDDDNLNIRFPNSDYNIKKGDRFVLLNIKPPSVFCKTASQRLLKEALKYFVHNDSTRFSFTPTIDNIWMAREHRKKKQEGKENESIYSTIQAGDLMMIESDDLGIGTSVRISSLTIKENSNAIPEFEVQLQDKKSVGTIQRMQSKLEYYTNSGGGGLSYDQVKNVISDSGKYKFISKRDDDFAEGQITMEKGLVAQSSHNGSETAADGIIEYFKEEE